jgi:hypothetical protein
VSSNSAWIRHVFVHFSLSLVDCLMTLSVSRLYSFDERMINEYGVAGVIMCYPMKGITQP